MAYGAVAGCLELIRLSQSHPRTKLALEFLILTAARSSEVRGAVWSEVDTEARMWVVPADRMKADRPHLVPLSDRALAVLQQARQFSDGSEVIFAGERYGKAMSDQTLLRALRRAHDGVDVHGFRSSFRTWVSEETLHQRETAEAALAHSIGDKVEAAYDRSSRLAKRSALMGHWGDYVSGASEASLAERWSAYIAPKPEDPGQNAIGEVVSLVR